MKFLVTAIGSMSADAVLTSLKENFPGCEIIGTDIHPKEWLYLSDKVDAFYRVPKSSSENFIFSIVEILKKHEVDFIIPLTDPEVDELSKKRKNLGQFASTLTLAHDKTISICRDKEKFAKYFKTNSKINVIRSFSSIEIENLNFPMVAKPKRGRSSEGLKYISNEDDLRSLGNNYLIQEYLKGPIITVDFVRDNFGNVVSVPRKELIRTSNGAGISVKILHNKKIEKIVTEIAEKLDIIGCMNVEFIYSKGSYYLMDINPRFSAGVGFSFLAGYDFILNHIRVFTNNEIIPKRAIKYGIATKHYFDYKLT